MEPLGIDERREVWGHVGSRENSRRVTGFPGRAERRGVWGPDEFEARHGFPGTRRASGGLGGPTKSRRVTGFPGGAERWGVWGARRMRPATWGAPHAPGGVGGADARAPPTRRAERGGTAAR